MVRGIGVDVVAIAELAGHVPEGAGGGVVPDGAALDAFVLGTFTEAELAQAWGRPRPAQYLAGRLAVKKAVLKAVAPVEALASDGFDLRVIECIDGEDGAPRVTLAGPLLPVLARAGTSDVLVSISNEAGLAIAFAVAQG